MSETPKLYETEQAPPTDPHTALYQHVQEGMRKQSMLYEYLMDSVVSHLPGQHPQAVEDALNMLCVSLSKTPLDGLLLIHEFLRNYQAIVQREHPHVPEQASPFFGREE